MRFKNHIFMSKPATKSNPALLSNAAICGGIGPRVGIVSTPDQPISVDNSENIVAF